MVHARGLIVATPLTGFVAAVSVGIVGGAPVLDLDYAEDSGCDTDMNVVMTEPADSSSCRGPPRRHRSRVSSSTSSSSLPPPASRSWASGKRKRLLQLAVSALPTLNWDEALLRLALAAVLGRG